MKSIAPAAMAAIEAGEAIVTGAVEFTPIAVSAPPPDGPPDFAALGVLYINAEAAIEDLSPAAQVLTIGAGVVRSTDDPECGVGTILFPNTGRIAIADNSDFLFADEDFTAEFWATPVDPNATYMSVWTTSITGQRCWSISHGLGFLEFSISTDGSDATTLLTGPALAANTKVHICVERAGDTWRLYVNGVMADKGVSSAVLFASSAAFCLGSIADFASYYNGTMDCVTVTRAAKYDSDDGFVPTCADPESGGGGGGESGGTIRLWGGYGPITIGGNRFEGVGAHGLAQQNAGAIGGVAQGLTLSLSGLEPAALQLLDSSEIKGASAVVYRLIFASDGKTLLDAHVFDRGRTDTVDTDEVIGGEAAISVAVESAARGLGRSLARMRADSDQRLIDADDGYFKATAYAGEKTLYWGGKKPNNLSGSGA